MPDIRVLDPAVAFRFEVQIGNANVGFSKVSGLREESDIIEYREGTDPIQHRKIPGLRTFPNVVCERGLGPATDMVRLRDDVIRCREPFRNSIVVKVKNCDGQDARILTFEKSWMVAIEIGDLDASASEVAIEMLEFAHEGRIGRSIMSA